MDPHRTGLSVAYYFLNHFYLDKVSIEKHANKISVFIGNSYSLATYRRRDTRSRAVEKLPDSVHFDFLFSPETYTSKNLIRKKKIILPNRS